MYERDLPRRLSAPSAATARLIRLGSRSRGIFVMSAGSVAGVGAAFLRGVILAHLLAPRNFGLGVILVTVAAALDMFADAGLDKFVVQSRFGFRRDIVRTAHYYRVVGSLLVGVAIVVLAYPLALAFRAPTMFPAIALTGGVVVLRGFVDLTYKLQQRDHRFETEAFIEISRSTLEVVVLFAVAWAYHSYWAVIAGAYANAALQVLLSRSTAGRPYSLRPRRRLLRLVGKFSTPIYLNAALLFAAIQGDRIVVATLFAKSDLAFYTVACALSQGLTVVINRVTANILLPRMAKSGLSDVERRKRSERLGFLMITMSTVFLFCMTVVGPLATTLIYGSRFHGITAIIYASSIVNMIQIEQVWVSTLLIAHGRTSALPLITIMRASAVPIAVVFATVGASLLAVPLAFAVGTAISLAVTYRATAQLRIIPRRVIVFSFLRIFIAIGISPLLASIFPVALTT